MKLIAFAFALISCTSLKPIQTIYIQSGFNKVLPLAYYSNVSASGSFYASNTLYNFNGSFRINVNENTGYINSVTLTNYTTNFPTQNYTVIFSIVGTSDYTQFTKNVNIRFSAHNSSGKLIYQDTFTVRVNSTGPRLI